MAAWGTRYEYAAWKVKRTLCPCGHLWASKSFSRRAHRDAPRNNLGLRRTMLAAGGIQALFGQAQPLDRSPAYDVRLNDLCDVRFADPAIPDGVGIDHHVRPVLTLVEASGLVRANAPLQAVGS